MAKEIDKDGKLKNDALIYQKREDDDSKSEYEKLDRRGKLQFFRDYYLKTILVIAGLAAIAVFYLVEAMTKPQNILYVAIADDVFQDEQVDKLKKAAATYLGADGKRQVVEINTSFSYSNSESNQQLQNYIYAGACDVVIAPEESFGSWAQSGYFLEPETSDIVSFYSDVQEEDRLYTMVFDGETLRGEKEVEQEIYNFGISVKDSRKYKELGGFGETAYAGIVNSSQHQEEAAAFLQYLLDDTLKEGDVNPDFVIRGE